MRLPYKTLSVVLSIVVLIVAFSGCKKKDDFDHSVPSEYIVEYPDVEKYFQENSNIQSVSSVKDSNKSLSEKEAIQALSSRGFSDYPVTTEYTIKGEYIDKIEVSDSSNDKHPMYDSFYINSSGELWALMIIEDAIMATPVSFNMQSNNSVQIVVSEREEIVSYDSSTNSFYRTIPNNDVMDLHLFDRIDSRTLDSLTVEVLSNG